MGWFRPRREAPELRWEVTLAFEGTCEDGHVYHFLVERVLAGPVIPLLKPGPGPLGPVADGFLMVPPFGPAGEEDAWGLGFARQPRRVVFRMIDTGRRPDQVELFQARPGSGLGEYLPPGTITEEGTYLLLRAIEAVPAQCP
jgi:hypothetical protein